MYHLKIIEYIRILSIFFPTIIDNHSTLKAHEMERSLSKNPSFQTNESFSVKSYCCLQLSHIQVTSSAHNFKKSKFMPLRYFQRLSCRPWRGYYRKQMWISSKGQASRCWYLLLLCGPFSAPLLDRYGPEPWQTAAGCFWFFLETTAHN